MKSRNLIKNGNADSGLQHWESLGVDVVIGERTEVTNINKETGDVTVENVDNPAFRISDSLMSYMQQRVKLSKRADNLEVSFSYLTTKNNTLGHQVTLVVEYSSNNVQRYIMPLRDDYRAIKDYEPFLPKKPSKQGEIITSDFKEAGTFAITVEWIEHYSYVDLLKNEEVVDVRLEVVGRGASGYRGLLDNISLLYYFNRGDVGELTYVTIPAGTVEMPVFSTVTEQTITDVYIMPTTEINGETEPLKLELVNKANNIQETDEVICTLTYTDLMHTVPYEVVEWGNVDKAMIQGHGLSFRVTEGTIPLSTLTIVWYYEAPTDGFVDEDGEFIEEGEE